MRRIAAKEELSLNMVAKDEVISEVLLKLQNNNDIILKGGTAINRVYIKNKRFSEDIDCDLIFKGEIKAAITRTNEIMGNIKGLTIARPRIMKGTIRYDLTYINPLQNQDKIRVEFKVLSEASNYSKRIVYVGFVPSDPALMNVYDVEEIIRQKIDCIMHRMEGKDFFDVYYLLDIPHAPIKELKEKKKEIIKRILLEEKQIKIVANIANHYIPRGRRPEWDSFLEEVRQKIEKY